MTVRVTDYLNFTTIYEDIHNINETDDFYILDDYINVNKLETVEFKVSE